MRSDYIEREFFALICGLMRKDNALAVRVSLETGLRIGDVLALRRENLTEGGAVEVTCKKTKKLYKGSLTARTASELRANGGGAWLFPSPRNVARHKTRQAVWADIKKAAKKCGVRVNVTPHTARKIHAVETFQKKGLNEVQKELQHDRVETTLLYAFADALTQTEGAAKKTARATEPTREEALRFFATVADNLGGAAAVFEAIKAALGKGGKA